MEDLRHVVVMFGQVLGVCQDIVDVDNDETMEELPEHLIHVSLDHRG